MKADNNQQLIQLGDKFMTIISYTLLGFVLAYLLFSLISYTLSSQPAGEAFGMIPDLRMPTFADMRWVTAIGGCSININDLYTGKSVGCDPFGRMGIGYPPMSLWAARFLRIKGDHTPLISLTISLSFIGVILSQMRSLFRSGWLLILVGSLFLIGFPVQLGLERMNIDILIFLLLYLSVLFFSLPALVWLFPLIIFTVSLKYFPFFAFFALMLKGLPSKPGISHPVPPWLILLAGSCIGLALSLPWSDDGVIVAAGGLNSHGLIALGFLNRSLIDSFGLANARLMIMAMFAMKILMIASGAYMAFKLNLAHILKNSINIQSLRSKNSRFLESFYLNLFIAMTSVWLGCYIVTISFDYRMIFLFPALNFIARTIQLSPYSHISSLQKSWLVCLLAFMLASMLIPLIGHSYNNELIRIGIDSIAEFVFIPFFASSLFVIILSLIVMARRPSALIAQR